MKRYCLPLVLLVFLSSIALAAPAETAKLPSTVVPAPHEGRYAMARHEAMNNRIKQGNVDLLMIGDSITDGWRGKGNKVWKEYYANRNAVNLGVGGDRTEHVLWRLENGNIDGISPKLAVLMIGTNNSGSNTPEEIAQGVEAIVKKLRTELPEMKILVLAIFPRGETPQDQRRIVNQKANEIIAKLADGKQVMYLDIGEKFLEPDGTLTREVMPDLLHPGPAAYKTWAEAIEPVVEKVLGKRSPATEEGFVPLFDGKTLNGWVKKGGNAKYTVEDGCIVGRRGPGGNTFLCTKKKYGDFILKLELKLDEPINSGVQFRSHARKNGRVYGYQCEVDPTERGWSGGIYDEARRAWLFKLDKDPAAQKAFKLNDWNTYVIKAVGPNIKTWVNGVPCADLTDKMDAEGFIGLQVHKADKGQIRWRNIRIKELGGKK